VRGQERPLHFFKKDFRNFLGRFIPSFPSLSNSLGPESKENYPTDLRDAILSYKQALDEKCQEVAQLEKDWRCRNLQAEAELQKSLLVLSAVTRGAIPLLAEEQYIGDTESELSYLETQIRQRGIHDSSESAFLFWTPRDVQRAINYIGEVMMQPVHLKIGYRNLSNELTEYQVAFFEFLRERELAIDEEKKHFRDLLSNISSAENELPKLLFEQLRER
jgi:hypothetical protein